MQRKKRTTEEPIHAHGILESRFLLWGLCLLICVRIVECCSVKEFDATIRWSITISSRICCLARKNFPHSVIRCCSNADAQTKCRTKVKATELRTRKSHSRAPPCPIPSSGHSSPGTADWPWNALAQQNRSPGWARPAAQSNSLGTADSPLTCAYSWGDKHQEY